ncbi:hypothetical protein [Actinopolymorpha alba]|uniref:hypothetical protein n=1 Tax=Actinopolymorpha alba TaxID=533267 RepID=UPI00036EE763|nr:hypothetical protein [Actinopolymorpha alba]
MDLQQARALRDVLEGTRWIERSKEFGRALRTSTRRPGGLLLMGPPDAEPWHLTAHLDDEARFARLAEIAPTLVRWNPPTEAPPHLAVGLDRLSATRRGESLLVVAESAPPDALLERVDDVRRKGANVFALENGQSELSTLAHEVLTVDVATQAIVSFENAQHLVSIATTESGEPRLRGLRARLNRLLDTISGPDA